MYHIIDNLNVGPSRTRIAVVTFSQYARSHIYLDQYNNKKDLKDAISGMTYEYGNTNTASGIKLMRSGVFSRRRGDRPNVPNFGKFFIIRIQIDHLTAQPKWITYGRGFKCLEGYHVSHTVIQSSGNSLPKKNPGISEFQDWTWRIGFHTNKRICNLFG